LLAEIVALCLVRDAGENAVDEIQMGSEVVGCIPLDAADVGSSWDRWTLLREVPRHVEMIWVRGIESSVAARGGDSRSAGVIRFIAGLWRGDHVQVVQEDPEYFFSYVCNFFAPDSVWARASHVEDESNWALRLAWLGVSKVG
jgi:hypothetical protein